MIHNYIEITLLIYKQANQWALIKYNSFLCWNITVQLILFLRGRKIFLLNIEAVKNYLEQFSELGIEPESSWMWDENFRDMNLRESKEGKVLQL